MSQDRYWRAVSLLHLRERRSLHSPRIDDHTAAEKPSSRGVTGNDECLVLHCPGPTQALPCLCADCGPGSWNEEYLCTILAHLSEQLGEAEVVADGQSQVPNLCFHYRDLPSGCEEIPFLRVVAEQVDFSIDFNSLPRRIEKYGGVVESLPTPFYDASPPIGKPRDVLRPRSKRRLCHHRSSPPSLSKQGSWNTPLSKAPAEAPCLLFPLPRGGVLPGPDAGHRFPRPLQAVQPPR